MEVMSYFNHPDFHHYQRKHPSGESLYIKRSGPIPAAVDWRTKGAVTPIGNQEQCGSSPYWSAVVSMEGAWAIAGNPLTNFSVQQINDCSGSFGNQGCNGGFMTSSFSYVISTGGVERAEDYPYTGTDDTCTFNARKVMAKFSSFKNIPAGDEQAFTEALTIAPVASAVSAQDTGFLYYSSGIFDSATCNTTQPCHGIGVVGYGSNEQGDYYILKNTWGVTWGMEGYMYLARNKGNMCNIALDGSYIIV
jgi:cathepsin L